MLIARIAELSGTALAIIGLWIQLVTSPISTAAQMAGWRIPTMLHGDTLPTGCSDCKNTAGAATAGAVRIEFEGRGDGFRCLGISQGTIVAGTYLLTHNHFAPALQSFSALTLTLTDVKGNQTQIAVDPHTIRVIDAGTLLIPLTDRGFENAAPLVHENGTEIQQGESVTTFYLDSQGQPMALELPVLLYDTVTTPGLTSLILKDHSRTIEPGDSGGGVYYRGELIGNLWAIGPAEDGGNYVRVGLFPLP